jgi:fatty-acyl-CoA synthase
MPTEPNPYRQGLPKTPANYVPLTPISFIEWAADVYPDYCAVIHGPLRRSWHELYARSRQLASVLMRLDIGLGDTVAAVLPNIPAMIEAHYGVPMTGAVLNSINTRLDPAMIAFIVQHSQSKVVLVDRFPPP